MTYFDDAKLFSTDGHLTDAGLLALRDGQLDELGSLDAAEHLSFCDACLERYTTLLEAAPEALLTPLRDVSVQVQGLLRMRSIRIFTNRYVSVAAAVVLAFGLWHLGAFDVTPRTHQPARTEKPKFSISESLSNIFGTVGDSVSGLLDEVQLHAQNGFLQLSDTKTPAPDQAKAAGNQGTTD
ncbi:MAG: hypothetical protein PHO10_05155 [Gemmiger sp.]|nr:hypothetical protein [Gemmiger sp.]